MSAKHIRASYNDFKISKVVDITSMITTFKRRFKSDYRYEGESHDFWEFDCILDGNVSISVDDKVYELHKGQMIFLNPLEFHNLRSANSTNPEVLIMSFKLSDNFLFDKRIVSVREDKMKELINLLNTAKEIFTFDGYCVSGLKDDHETEMQIFKNKLEIFLLEIIKGDETVEKQVNTKSAVNYSKIIKTLKENIDKNLTIKDIAALTNMSESNVKKVFAMYTNRGIMVYFNDLKMTQAKKLIREGKSVYEVSKALGFSEQNYFSNVFKKATGYSPKNWLKVFNEKQEQ